MFEIMIYLLPHAQRFDLRRPSGGDPAVGMMLFWQPPARAPPVPRGM